MKTFDDFLPYVLPDVPGCPESVASDAIVSAAIEFCEKSLVLQRDHDPVNVLAGRPDYDLDSPISQMLVCKVMKAWFLRHVLTPVGPDDMDDPYAYQAALGQSGSNYGVAIPMYFVQKEERTITLWPAPQSDTAQGLTLRVALKPMRAATSFDDVLFEDWVDVITAGAKAALQTTPGKTFTNPQLALGNQGAFMAGTNRAMVRGNKGLTRTSLSVRMRNL